jgi:ectoine hydroxylase-related dioxygenase (phytanoyl-CoA dioxygenase family)
MNHVSCNSKDGYVAPDQIDPVVVGFYEKNGYLVVEDALDVAALEALKQETVDLCRGKRGQIGGLPAVEQADDDEQVQRQVLCIHHPHKVSPLIHQHLGHPVVVDVLTMVIGPDVKCMQSMLFIKASGKPGQAWHQDEDFIPTRDRSLTGAWIALDDATVENGCLWVLPGSHKPGVLWPMHAHTDKRFDCTYESIGFPYKDEDAVPVEVKAGSIVFFNGYTLHRSLPNQTTGGFRRVLVNHYMSAQSLLPWMPTGDRAVATSDYRDIVMVAGADPYAYKGVENIAKSHIRADGNGGCSDGRELR